MSSIFQIALHPAPEVDRQDTSLKYTDILFGFVLRELFVRLQNWPLIGSTARLHLVAGTVLVLGSWIGYRRSLNRSTYGVKFFNLPFWRFVVDQLMLIVYFRLTVLIEYPWRGTQDLSALSGHTARLVFYAFVLYLIWDLLGIWTATATVTLENGTRKPRYPAIDRQTNTPTGLPSPVDWVGFGITVAALSAVAVVLAGGNSLWVLPSLIVVLLGYRWAKEIRTSSQEIHHA